MSAVLVQSAYKSYGSKEVLRNFQMQVPKSSIYGLLGASGCGKTTLLSCIVGMKKLNDGEIWVLGGKPGTVGSGVPGPKVGYMPQEIALVGEFTVEDAIYYFGRIFDMADDVIEERFVELSKLLELPPRTRYVRDCSGGQQRRISLASSMVHKPELLILDEPTVGVDPILRERIWDYLVEVTSKTNMAVIITTHYIEEARQANVIGLMRDGCLLAEESPTSLLNRYQTEVLEDVFFMLSRKQTEGTLTTLHAIENNHSIQNSNTDISLNSFNTTTGSRDVLTTKAKPKKINGYRVNRKRLNALVSKNAKQFYRNIAGVVFVVLFPIVQTLCCLFAIGPDIKDIKLAIVNEETSTTLCRDWSWNDSAVPYGYASCHFSNLSCRFLTYIEDPMIYKVQYDNLIDAKEGVKHGDVVGVVYMAQNFSQSFEDRLEEGRHVEKSVLNFSNIDVWLDMSNRQIGGTIKYKLYQRFMDFQKDLLNACNLETKIADLYELTTFYGNEHDALTDFVTPGIVLTIMFFMMTVMTSQIIITDRCEGVWDRSMIAGVSSIEITLAHCVIQVGIVMTYTVIVLVITFAIFKIGVAGSLWVIVALTFLQGLAGVGYGFWVSIVSYNVSMANVITTGSFYIMILICGLMWPLEAMPLFLQWIAKCLPFTVPILSFRNVMKKGWSITNSAVWDGISIEVGWIILFAVVNIVLIQSKR